MDVKGAYLHAPIERNIYISQPQGYEASDKDGKTLVWTLKKSLCSFKQSGRNWHNVLHDHLKELNFVQSNVDPCVSVKNDENGTTILLVWVDDIIVAVSSSLISNEIKQHLSSKFNMKDLGSLPYFLGIQFEQNEGVIRMAQFQCLKKILEKFGSENCKPRATPCETNPDAYRIDTVTDEVDPRKYCQMAGSLVNAMICTRPDLSYIVTKLAQHLPKPNAGD